jgi:4-hydroxybenzoate polyprenyltransferase
LLHRQASCPVPNPPVKATPWSIATGGYLLKAMRPKQWVKNLIAFAPLFFAGQVPHVAPYIAASLCVVAFCLIAGGIYLLNDVLDAEADRKHPLKCMRPIASGKLSPKVAVAASVFTVSLGLFLSFLIRPSLLLVTVAYFLLSVAYSLKLKHMVILDVSAIAAGFVLRAFAGAVAVSLALSGWFMMCTVFGALFLALEKRRQELRLLGEESLGHRKSLGSYSIELLDRMEGIIVPSLLTSYAIYSFMSAHGEAMLLTVPFVLYGVMRYQLLSVKYCVTGSPEEVFWKDRPIQFALAGWLLTSAFVVDGGLHWASVVIGSMDNCRIAVGF